MNSQIEEINFFISISSQLLRDHPDHNEKFLRKLIGNLKYEKEILEKNLMAKFKDVQNREKITKNHHHYKKLG